MLATGDADRVQRSVNLDVIRRLLIKYFIDKGFTSTFNRQIHPALLQDLTSVVPGLAAKIEIVPHVHELDSFLNKAVVRWDLFVLGTRRLYLGETHYQDLLDLARQARSGRLSATGLLRHAASPKAIVAFILRVLADHEAGFIDLRCRPTSNDPAATWRLGGMLTSLPQQLRSPMM